MTTISQMAQAHSHIAEAQVKKLENNLSLIEAACFYGRFNEVNTKVIFKTMKYAHEKTQCDLRHAIDRKLMENHSLVARLFAIALKREFDCVKSQTSENGIRLFWDATFIELRMRGTNDFVCLVPTGTYQGNVIRKVLISTSLLGVLDHALKLLSVGGSNYHTPARKMEVKSLKVEVSVGQNTMPNEPVQLSLF